MLLNDVAQVITNELIELWKLNRIPYKTMNAIKKSVIRLIKQWKKHKVESRVNPEEQSKLNKLFNLRPSNLLTEEALKNYLMKYSYLSWFRRIGVFCRAAEPQPPDIKHNIDNRSCAGNGRPGNGRPGKGRPGKGKKSS